MYTSCAHALLPLIRRPELAAQGVEFILPTDVIIADKFAEDAESKVVPVENIPDGWMVCPAFPAVNSSCIASKQQSV